MSNGSEAARHAQSYQGDPYAFMDGKGARTRRGGNALSRFAGGVLHAIGISGGLAQKRRDTMSYDELMAEWEKARQRGETMFILPEYQRFKHVFRKIDPRVIDNLCDENLEQCGVYLQRAYIQCLRRLENVISHGEGMPPQQVHDYNCVVTKHWMLVVLRKTAEFRGIHCNALAYLGVLPAMSESQRTELENLIKPVELLRQMAVSS